MGKRKLEYRIVYTTGTPPSLPFGRTGWIAVPGRNWLKIRSPYEGTDVYPADATPMNVRKAFGEPVRIEWRLAPKKAKE